MYNDIIGDIYHNIFIHNLLSVTTSKNKKVSKDRTAVFVNYYPTS